MSKFKRLVLVILMMSTIIILGCSKEGDQLSQKEKVDDFNYLYKTIAENYPFLEVNKRVNNVDWLSNKDDYLQRVKDSKTDNEFLLEMQSIISDLNNDHTNMIIGTEQFKSYREVYSMSGWQKDVILPVLNNKKALKRYNVDKNEKIEVVEQAEKGEIEGIQNAYVKDIIQEEIAYIYIPQMISYYNMGKDTKLLDDYFNQIKNYDAIVIDIRDNGGGDSAYWQNYLVPKLIDKTYEQTTYSFWRDGDIIRDFIKKSKIEKDNGFGEVSNLNTSKLKNLPPEIKTDFKYYYKSANKINPNKDSIKFKGNVYLLVNKGVYSSSEKLASFSKESGFATLIGEKTGGDGIGSDPLIAVLPNSGYAFRFSKDMGVIGDGTCNEEFKTEPDYIVEAPMRRSFEEDNCIKKVIELEKKK